MDLYVDTSALIRLYVPEDFTDALAAYVATRGKAVAIHDLHVLEMENGVRAKLFRKEMTEAQCHEVLSRIGRDINAGLLVRRPVDWHDVFRVARGVSLAITGRSGCRTLDMLHIAAAVHWRCALFLSLDERQIKAAAMAHLKIVDVRT